MFARSKCVIPWSNAVRSMARAFSCMACDAHGGDVLAFQMQRHGQRFVDAARELGAWGPM